MAVTPARPDAPWARFDDAATGSAWSFPPGGEVLVAHRPDEVAPVLRAAEERTAGGAWAYGYVAYEAAPAFSPELRTHPPTDGLPLAWFVVTAAPRREPVITAAGSYVLGPWVGDWGESDHRARVERVRAHIAAGDTYQVNLTTRLTAHAAGDMLGLHADLVARQGGAHHAYLDTGRFTVVSASPELFFEMGEDTLTMRPMKGTAARGATEAEDRDLADRLVRSEKERAENIMIVDLVRNDLSRVATVGSVRVAELLRVEHYRTVHQLTSRVTATRRDGATLVDVFAALFPCGSVTGAPKARTMELITELEPAPRGILLRCDRRSRPAPRAVPRPLQRRHPHRRRRPRLGTRHLRHRRGDHLGVGPGRGIPGAAAQGVHPGASPRSAGRGPPGGADREPLTTVVVLALAVRSSHGEHEAARTRGRDHARGPATSRPRQRHAPGRRAASPR